MHRCELIKHNVHLLWKQSAWVILSRLIGIQIPSYFFQEEMFAHLEKQS